MNRYESLSRRSLRNSGGAQAPLFFERHRAVKDGCRAKPADKLHDEVL
jgi:hypothetical protein